MVRGGGLGGLRAALRRHNSTSVGVRPMIRKASDCRVTACVGDHVHIELLDETGVPFAELVLSDVDEATRLIMQIEKQCDDIMNQRATVTH